MLMCIAVCCSVLQYVEVWCAAMVSEEQADNRSLADRLVAVCVLLGVAVCRNSVLCCSVVWCDGVERTGRQPQSR